MAITIATFGDTLQTAGKFFHVLEEEGLLDEVPHILINDKSARAQAVQYLNLLVGSSSNIPNYQRARDILGDDFISPQEVAEVRGVRYTETQLARLQGTLPQKEVLKWARDNGFIVVAGPPSEMNLLGIRELNSQLFWSKSGGWYANKKEKFARRDTVGTNWFVLRRNPVPASTRKSWGEQQELLSDAERVPNAAEQTYSVTTYFEVRGIRLVSNVYVRTSSVDSDGLRVGVGLFDGYGLLVGLWSDDFRDDGLGVAAARK